MSLFRNLLIAKAFDQSKKPLTFTAKEANSTVTLNAIGNPTVSGLFYRHGMNGVWSPYTVGTVLTLDNIGDRIQFWNTETSLSSSQQNYAQFATTGKLAASGNLQSMLNWIDSVPAWGFYRLFYDNKALTTLPEFTAATLGAAAYYSVCEYCNGLDNVSLILPAKHIANAGYALAFRYAVGLKEVEIPASQMDVGYSNLYHAFADVSTLNKITVHFTEWKKDWQGNDSFWTNWVANVSSTGTFYKPSALPEEYGVNRIPEGWTVVNID